MIRTALNRYYQLSTYISCTALCLICSVVFIQVLFNTVNKAWELCFGSSPGLLIPSYDTITGYLLVATTFFAAAYTFQKGEHIRVNLLLSRIKSAKALFVIEAISVAVVLVLMCYAVRFSISLAWDSWEYQDVSAGIIPIPLWIPQCFMILGLLTFVLALVDTLITMFKTGELPFSSDTNEV